ncbi:MAG: hypothetical protein AAF416_12305 [Pseudomonadota bacterium]
MSGIETFFPTSRTASLRFSQLASVRPLIGRFDPEEGEKMRDKLLYLAVMSSFLAEFANADTVNVFFSENAFGVQIEGNGSINLTGLTPSITFDSSIFFVNPEDGAFGAGANGPVDTYFAGEFTPFGSGGDTTNIGSGTGDIFGLAFSGVDLAELLLLPAGYVSGDPLSFTVSFAGETLASLGIDALPATTVIGMNDINFSLAEAPSAVPLPEAMPMLLLGIASVGWVGSRRRRATRPSACGYTVCHGHSAL